MLGIEGVGNFFLVHPGIGIELGGLCNMRKPARHVEATVGKRVGRLELSILAKVDDWTGIQHQARDAFFRQDLPPSRRNGLNQ